MDPRKHQHQDGTYGDEDKQTRRDAEIFQVAHADLAYPPSISPRACRPKKGFWAISTEAFLIGDCEGKKKPPCGGFKSPLRDVVGFLSEVRLLLGRSSGFSHCDSSWVNFMGRPQV
ncbi:hypothetical protein [Rhodoferax lacus]|uniref:hypothetical protein n=1 Tax=Rhodoferax lacus TaxID=2184758 RepID=UPI0011C16060|nr:hypothetical protein [Rhodoferax lacus]